MHVVLISQSTGAASLRVRSVLDRFAVRYGSDSWMTPITIEGLEGLRKDLLKVVSRDVGVACYRNFGRQKMTLLWTVGSRSGFSETGAVAIATRRRKPSHPPTGYKKTIIQLAYLAGLTHDLGKMNAFFQAKLAYAKKIGDPVRHEWLSGLLLEQLWEDKAPNLGKAIRESDVFLKRLATRRMDEPLDALRWAVTTHHKMLGGDSLFGPTRDEHDRTRRPPPLPQGVVLSSNAYRQAAADLPERIIEIFRKKREELGILQDWTGAAIIARAALILGDHYWSAQAFPKKDNQALRANSASQQSLLQHLVGVARHSELGAEAFFDTRGFSGMSPESLDAVTRPAPEDSRFVWQNRAADALTALRDQHTGPVLVLNLAGTGSGKTRANMRCLASLATEKRPFRVTSVFNLRTLTRQTHRAYRHELGISDGDMACIVGNRFSYDPEEGSASRIKTEAVVALEDDDTSDPQSWTEYEVNSEEGGAQIPDSLERLLSGDPQGIRLLTPPVLVSTVDYVIAAGDFSDMRHHSSALLRIAHSDLILDEIDGYEPAALGSVFRVIYMAGLFGRNVVASSATLPKPVADGLYRAFQSGCEARSAMIGKPVEPRYAFVDDRNSPSVCSPGEFLATYDAQVDALASAVASETPKRSYRMAPIEREDLDYWCERIDAESRALHQDHHFVWNGLRVSIGLFRIANVRPCVELARNLSSRNIPDLWLCSYHASDLQGRRAMKEAWLDAVLTRKTGDAQAVLANEELREILREAQAAERQDVRFLVIATPVEEVGRDHDFDWAIIEPSSIQSIVQTAGRVNRHRLKPVDRPNVVILQRNHRSFHQDRAFAYPGYEQVAQRRYPSHEMGELLNKPEGAPLHAGWRIGSGKTEFAELDDGAIEYYLREVLQFIDKPNLWHQAMFKRYDLRKQEGGYPHRFLYDSTENQVFALGSDGRQDTRTQVHPDNHLRTFFCPETGEVEDFAKEHDLNVEAAMEFSVFLMGAPGKPDDPIAFDPRFGGYRPGKRG